VTGVTANGGAAGANNGAANSEDGFGGGASGGDGGQGGGCFLGTGPPAAGGSGQVIRTQGDPATIFG
jgi:hypothetical protein